MTFVFRSTARTIVRVRCRLSCWPRWESPAAGLANPNGPRNFRPDAASAARLAMLPELPPESCRGSPFPLRSETADRVGVSPGHRSRPPALAVARRDHRSVQPLFKQLLQFGAPLGRETTAHGVNLVAILQHVLPMGVERIGCGRDRRRHDIAAPARRTCRRPPNSRFPSGTFGAVPARRHTNSSRRHGPRYRESPARTSWWRCAM